MKFLVRRDVYEKFIEKAGFPVNTRHGSYVKVQDNPARWEFRPLQRTKTPLQNKTFVELTEKEKSELKEKLLKQNYKIIDNVYVAESKIKNEDPETLNQELKDAKKLASLGHKVYILPYRFAQGEKVRSPDTLTDDRFLEFKDIKPKSTKRNVRDDFISAKGQGEDVYINIQGKLNESECLKEMYRAIGIVKKVYPNNVSGILYFNFEKSGKLIKYNINKNGLVQKDKA